MNRIDAIERPCPMCGAAAGERCAGERGQPRRRCHRSRYFDVGQAPAPAAEVVPVFEWRPPAAQLPSESSRAVAAAALAEARRALGVAPP